MEKIAGFFHDLFGIHFPAQRSPWRYDDHSLHTFCKHCGQGLLVSPNGTYSEC